MEAEEYLHAGRLDDALQSLQAAVRKDPANPSKRIFLFQLLSVLGAWDRALNQLALTGELQASNIPLVDLYSHLIRSELIREAIFRGERSPIFFGEPERWMALLAQSSHLMAQEAFEAAEAARAEAFESAPRVSGRINGETFTCIGDADDRLGPVLEVVVGATYYWVPFHRIRSIRIDEPVNLRDAIWLPAYFTWSNDGQATGMIPVRYTGTINSGDPQLLLSRRTDWSQMSENTAVGLGQRILATDHDDYPLLDVREIVLDAAEHGEPESGV